jgi:hypothetical protein
MLFGLKRVPFDFARDKLQPNQAFLLGNAKKKAINSQIISEFMAKI